MAANIYHAATNVRGWEQKIKPRPNTEGKELKSEKWDRINASKLGNKFLLFLQTWSVFDSKPNKSNHRHNGTQLGRKTKRKMVLFSKGLRKIIKHEVIQMKITQRNT